MKRKIGFLLIFFILFVVVGFAIKLLGSRTPKEGELRVDATPAVSVFLDNKHIGRTPLREKVPAGDYTIRLVSESASENIAPWQSSITVGPNLLTYITATLSSSELASAVDVLWLEKSLANKPELSVVTNPDGASIILDDSAKGISPLTISDVVAGDHTMTISSPGFLTRTMKIKMTPGYKLIASMKLALTATGASDTSSEEASSSAEITPEPTGSTAAATGTPKVSPTGKTPEKPYVVIKDTPTGFLRVRSEPTTSSSESARVNPGETYHLFDEDSGWYEISYDGSNKGWVSGQYADKVE